MSYCNDQASAMFLHSTKGNVCQRCVNARSHAAAVASQPASQPASQADRRLRAKSSTSTSGRHEGNRNERTWFEEAELDALWAGLSVSDKWTILQEALEA